jgi:hypothetical protein
VTRHYARRRDEARRTDCGSGTVNFSRTVGGHIARVGVDMHWRWFRRPRLFSAAVLQRGSVMEASVMNTIKIAGAGATRWVLGEVEVSRTQWTSVSMGDWRFGRLVMLVIATSRLRGVVTRGRCARGDGRTLLRKHKVPRAFRRVWFGRNGRISTRTVHCHHELTSVEMGDHFTVPLPVTIKPLLSTVIIHILTLIN